MHLVDEVALGEGPACASECRLVRGGGKAKEEVAGCCDGTERRVGSVGKVDLDATGEGVSL